jgi:hypothetical protein
MYLGGAQGGIWISSTLTTVAVDASTTLAIGAIALAPSENADLRPAPARRAQATATSRRRDEVDQQRATWKAAA